MGLVKKYIHMSRIKGNAVTQITLEDDVIVPDVLPDIVNKITETGEILMDSVKIVADKVNVSGKLKFKMMYSTLHDVNLNKLEGSIEFDESINLDGIESGDSLNIDCDIDDLTIMVINSRKISVKAIVTINCVAEALKDEEIAVDLEDMAAEYITDNIEITQISMRKKDLLRVKDEFDIGKGKMGIGEIIWSTSNIYNSQSKVLDDKVNISGDISMFVLYKSEEGPLQWMDVNVPYNGMIDMPGSTQDMISNIDVKLGNTDIQAKPDYDGEPRVMAVDAMINVGIKLYEEKNISFIRDLYSTQFEMTPQTKSTKYEKLLIKNVSRCRTSGKVSVGNEQERVLQICNVVGNVKADDIQVVDGGILVEGAVDTSVLYVTSDDESPISCIKYEIPFSHKIECRDISEDSDYNVRCNLAQISAHMSGSNEIETKIDICMDCIVFDNVEVEVVEDVDTKEFDMKKISEMPGMVGYVVQKNEDLWKIAKKFYTSVEQIKILNDLKGNNVEEGDILLIVKNVS